MYKWELFTDIYIPMSYMNRFHRKATHVITLPSYVNRFRQWDHIILDEILYKLKILNLSPILKIL